MVLYFYITSRRSPFSIFQGRCFLLPWWKVRLLPRLCIDAKGFRDLRLVPTQLPMRHHLPSSPKAWSLMKQNLNQLSKYFSHLTKIGLLKLYLLECTFYAFIVVSLTVSECFKGFQEKQSMLFCPVWRVLYLYLATWLQWDIIRSTLMLWHAFKSRQTTSGRHSPT